MWSEESLEIVLGRKAALHKADNFRLEAWAFPGSSGRLPQLLLAHMTPRALSSLLLKLAGFPSQLHAT
jgi:hypothetical protein